MQFRTMIIIFVSVVVLAGGVVFAVVARPWEREPRIPMGRGNTPANIANVAFAAYSDGWIYYLTRSGDIYRMRNDGTGQEHLVGKPRGANINVLEEWIFFSGLVDGFNTIYRMNTATKVVEPIFYRQGFINHLTLIDGFLYFTQLPSGVTSRNDAHLYRIDTNGNSLKRYESIGTRTSCVVLIYDDYIYWSNTDHQLVKIHVDRPGVTILSENVRHHIIHNNKIYFLSITESEGGSLYRMDLDGSNREFIMHTYAYIFSISDEWIYYPVYDNITNVGSLYRFNIITGVTELVLEDTLGYVNSIAGDWLFISHFGATANFSLVDYPNRDRFRDLHMVRKDGTGLQLINR